MNKSDSKHSHEGKSRRLGPAGAIAITLLAFVLGQIFGGLFAWLLAGLFDPLLSLSLEQWFETTEAQFVIVVLSGVFTLLILWLFMRWLKTDWRTIGITRKPKWLDLGYSVLSAPVYFMLLILLGSLAGLFLGIDLEQEQEIGFEQVIGGADMLLAFISLVVIPPIVEEVLFRGFLFTGLRSKLNFVVTAVIVSGLFALPHIFASSHGLLWIAAVDTFVLSLVLCYLREKTGALWASISLHALKNGAAFIFLFVMV